MPMSNLIILLSDAIILLQDAVMMKKGIDNLQKASLQEIKAGNTWMTQSKTG